MSDVGVHIEAVAARLSECLGTEQTEFANEATFFEELGGDATDLRHFENVIHKALDIELEPVIDRLMDLCEFDDNGQLSKASLKRIADFLPTWSRPVQSLRLTDLFTVGLLGALLDVAAEQPLPLRKIPSTRITNETLGERRYRLLMTGCMKYSVKPFRKDHPLQAFNDAFLANEQYADTGKGKTAVRSAQRVLKQSRKGARAVDLFSTDVLTPGVANVVTGELADRFALSKSRAFREFMHLHEDLVSPIEELACFSEWRSDEVRRLAQTMYETRDFRLMFDLGDALQRAGCDVPEVLRHCRDPQRIHIRGCWVLDAILDESWKTPPRRKTAKKKPRLSLLRREVQHEIAALMEERDGALSLTDYVRKKLDDCRETLRTDEGRARLKEWHAQEVLSTPTLSLDQLEMLALFSSLREMIEFGIARRIVHNDPGELGRAMAIGNRLCAIDWTAMGKTGDVSDFLRLLAPGGIDFARRVIAEGRPGLSQALDERALAAFAVQAVLTDDTELLSDITGRMAQKRVQSSLAGIYQALIGIGERDPEKVCEGISNSLKAGKNARYQSLNLGAAVNFDAHGLYWLAKDVSPKLVDSFDIRQSYPWDAEFHHWCCENPTPLSAIDFSERLPELHEAISEGPTDSLPRKPTFEVILLSGDPDSKDHARALGERAQASRAVQFGRLLLADCPIAICWNLDRNIADRVAAELQSVKVDVEVREMGETPFRLLTES